MAAEEKIQNTPCAGWFLFTFCKMPSQLSNFNVISLGFNASDHLNLSPPTANEDHVLTMEVNRPLMLHLRRNEKRPVGQNPVNRKPQPHRDADEASGFDSDETRAVVLAERHGILRTLGIRTEREHLQRHRPDV